MVSNICHCNSEKQNHVWDAEILPVEDLNTLPTGCGCAVRVQVCGCASVGGCVGAWVHGCVGAWVRGCVGACTRGYLCLSSLSLSLICLYLVWAGLVWSACLMKNTDNLVDVHVLGNGSWPSVIVRTTFSLSP